MTLQQPQPVATPVRAAEPHPGGALVAALWMICVAAGFAGQRYPYSRPKPPEPGPPAVTVERVEVQLGTPPPVPMTMALPLPKLEMPPDAPPPDAPVIAPVAAALPSPQISFPVPVEAPAMIVERAAASYRVPVASNAVPSSSTATAPAPVPLTFGQGEGRQPAPSYPRQAVREGQEGTVVARFVVDARGRVTAAEPVKPSPWPLLNEETLRTIRNKWRFPEGRVRVYEVVIRFELEK